MRHLILIVATLGSSLALAQPTSPGHEFFCADYSGGKVFLVDRAGNVTWEHPAKSCNDIWALPNGNLLFTTGHGVLEVTREKKVVFEYQSKSEIYACQRLADGSTFVGECNAGRLLLLSADAKVLKEIRLLPEGKDGGHGYIRNCRVLDNGNFLVTHYGQGLVREYDGAGKIVREIPAPGGPHTAIRLKNGNTLISVGDMKFVKDTGSALPLAAGTPPSPDGKEKPASPDGKAKPAATANPRVFEVDPAGKVVWEFSNADLPDAPLKFMAGLHRLDNGNTVVCNWIGHGQFGKAPHLFEVTPEKKVVWSYANHKDFKTISSIQVLDTPADATRGQVQH